jgi:hypothetical protein
MSEQYRPRNGGSEKPSGLTDQARALGQDVKDKAVELGSTAARTAKEQAAELSDAAKGLASETASKVENALSQQKSAGAEYLAGLAQAVTRAAGEFDNSLPPAARYIRQAAGQLDGFADAVRDREVKEWVREAQDFARRQPGLFFGGALLLGFAALRFFKSAAEGPPSAASEASQGFPGETRRAAHTY